MAWTLVYLLFCLSLLIGCEKPAHEPCQVKLQVLNLPANFELSKDGNIVGTLTVNEDESLRFEASSTAQHSEVEKLQSVVAQMADTPNMTFSYRDSIADVSYSCGGNVARGTPEFADGVRRHLYSDRFYEVKTLE